MKRRAFSLIELLVVIGIIAVLMGLLLAVIQRVRATAVQLQCSNNLNQIGIALHAYNADKHHFPAARGMDPNAFTGYEGWVFNLLPYLGEAPLFAKYKGTYNVPSEFINVMICPADPRGAADGSGAWSLGQTTSGLNWYLGVAGSIGHYPQVQADAASFGVFKVDSSGIRANMITDGLSNTLMVGERPPSWNSYWGWWYFSDFDTVLSVQDYTGVGAGLIDSGCPVPGTYKPDVISYVCSATHFWSLHSGGGNWLFADGSVRFIPYSAAQVLIPLASCSGGEIVNPTDYQ